MRRGHANGRGRGERRDGLGGLEAHSWPGPQLFVWRARGPADPAVPDLPVKLNQVRNCRFFVERTKCKNLNRESTEPHLQKVFRLVLQQLDFFVPSRFQNQEASRWSTSSQSLFFCSTFEAKMTYSLYKTALIAMVTILSASSKANSKASNYLCHLPIHFWSFRGQQKDLSSLS